MRNSPCLLLGLIVSMIGCSGGGPPTESVSGAVTFEGQPVANAQIGFIPDSGQIDVKPAHGKTDEDGRFTLKTYVKPGQEVSGAMVGKFKVTVTQVIAENRIVDYDEISQQGETFPSVYSDANTTTLSATVTEDGDNEFAFALETSEN